MPVVRAVAVAAAAGFGIALARAGRNRAGYTVAGADRTGWNLRTAGQCISHCLPRHRIRVRDLESFGIVLHLAQVNRAADDLHFRKAEKEQAILTGNRTLSSIR